MFLVARALDLVLVYRHCIVILIRCSRQGPGLPFLTLLASIGELLATSLRLALTHRIMLLLTSIRGLITHHRQVMLASQASKTTTELGLQSTNQRLPTIICSLHRLRNRILNLLHRQAAITPLQRPHHVTGRPI
jgi:hypothetical protein